MLKTQAENTTKAAKKFMEENEKLKWVLKNQGKDEENILETENKKLIEDQEKLKTELKKASDALSKAQKDVMTMKMQSERLSKEYDRLLKEHSELQNRFEKESKKGLWTNFIKEDRDTPCQDNKFVIMVATKTFKIQFKKKKKQLC